MKLHLPASLLLTCLMLAQSILGGCRCVLDEFLHDAGAFSSAGEQTHVHHGSVPGLTGTRTCSYHGPDCPGHDPQHSDHQHAPQAVSDQFELNPDDPDLQSAVFCPLTELIPLALIHCHGELPASADLHSTSPPLYLTLQVWLI